MTHFGSKKVGIFKVKISSIENIKNDLSSSKNCNLITIKKQIVTIHLFIRLSSSFTLKNA